MSTSSHPALPPTPDLHWLKNRAKEKLAALRATDPAARLADAQHAIAKSHGFASWRALKSHVDSLRDEAAALVQSVRTGDLATMARILDKHPNLVDATTSDQQPIRPSDTSAMRLLHVAIAENQPGAANLLIARGANLNLRNHDGRLPLHDCFELGRDEIEKLLLDAGAQLDVVSAAVLGRHTELRNLLVANPALANDRSTNMTPLSWCAYANQDLSARILLEHGAAIAGIPCAYDAFHPTAHVASTRVLKVLLEFGADPNWQHDNGDTMMHWAIRSRMVKDPTEFIQLLLAHGANPNLKNRAGITPLEEALAARRQQYEQYFPAKPLGHKCLDSVILLLQAAANL